MLTHVRFRDAGIDAHRGDSAMSRRAALFQAHHVEAAVQFVARQAARDPAALVGYPELFDAAGLPVPRHLGMGADLQVLTRFVEAFHHQCSQLGFPPLDALLVHPAGERRGLPASGYFDLHGVPDPNRRSASAEAKETGNRLLQEQRDRCRRWAEARQRSTDRR